MVPSDANGTIAIVERPRPDDWLETDLRGLSASGVDLIVSCLTPPEVAELGLEAEASIAASLGINFVSIPIPDRKLPESALGFLSQLKPATDAFLGGSSVVAHCRAGIGRSTLIVATLLQQSGLAAEDALHRIETTRGRPVPDTEAQRKWVTDLETILRSSVRKLGEATDLTRYSYRQKT